MARVVLSAVVVAGLNAVRVRAGLALKADRNGSSTVVECGGLNQFSVQRKEKV